MTIFLLISILPLCTIIIWGCSNEKIENDEQAQTIDEDGQRLDPVIAFEETIDKTLNCRRILQFFLQIFTVFLL